MIEVVLAEGLERVRGLSRVGGVDGELWGVDSGPGERGQTGLNWRGRRRSRGWDFQQL